MGPLPQPTECELDVGAGGFGHCRLNARAD